VVSALSESLSLETVNESGRFELATKKGFLTRPWRRVAGGLAVGTRITFKPDPEIFGGQALEWSRIRGYCRDRARMQPNIRFEIVDCRDAEAKRLEIVEKDGILNVVAELSMGWSTFPKAWFHKAPVFPVTDLQKGCVLAAGLAFTERAFARFGSYMNFAPSPDGGTHVKGFQRAIEDAFERTGVPKERRAGLRRGMVGAIHVVHPEPKWEGCTRSKVGNEDLVELVRESLAERLAGWMEENLLREGVGRRTEEIVVGG